MQTSPEEAVQTTFTMAGYPVGQQVNLTAAGSCHLQGGSSRIPASIGNIHEEAVVLNYALSGTQSNSFIHMFSYSNVFQVTFQMCGLKYCETLITRNVKKKVKEKHDFYSVCFIQGFCIKFLDLTWDIFIDTAIIQQICHYQTYNVPLLQLIKYHNYQRYQYRLLCPARKEAEQNNSEQYVTVFTRKPLVLLVCVHVCACVCVEVKCCNKGIFLCTLLNY